MIIINHRPALPALLTVLLAACATPEPAPRINEEVPFDVVDMSGNWEKDYQLSDDFQTEFNLYMFDIQRKISNQNDARMTPNTRTASRETR